MACLQSSWLLGKTSCGAGKGATGTPSFLVVFTFVSVALTGLLEGKWDCDSKIIRTREKIIEHVTELLKSCYFTVGKLNDMFR